MKQFRVLVSTFLLLLVSIVSCRKATLIGDELIPDSDFLHSLREDSFSIITNTFMDDSIVTSFNLFYCLGSLQDDILGKTSANIYTQVLMPTNNLNFGANAIIDSIVLQLDYAGLYGDTLATHTLRVYKMLENIETSSLYYSDARLHYLPIEIGSKIDFLPNTKDSITVDTVKYPAHLRIKLSDWFAQDLINDPDSTRFIDNSTFLNFLNGLYIQEDTSAGFSNSIMYFSLSSSLSGMKVYYKNDDADSLNILFPFTGNKFNFFTHNYEGAAAHDYLATPDTILGDSLTLIQGFGGLKTFVKFPFLDSLKGVSINKAELVFTVQGTELDTIFSAPPAMLLVKTDSTFKNIYDGISFSEEIYHSLPDQSFSDPLNYGGRLDTITNIYGQTVYAYSYNISLYVQDIVLGKQDNDGLMLVCYPGNRIPNGVTLCGSNYIDSTKRPYLSITYTLVDP